MVAQAKGDAFEGELAGLDLGKIEDIETLAVLSHESILPMMNCRPTPCTGT
jgi:hypothetical protein